ncbi:unnamed protein product [Acanthoscelides obtectus]|uniref:Uncharacterized protein n=1 Tax=Acanthoscelides obtectus TaxID=200917 RepID=A0A9P0LCN5_ACAOB|nr:unnamed protein product [Acanthoscelides obtectus]CAK1658416.1 hypothetical protein AOBTE_LOCUS20873 [Acanthoscelides obtectus]
MFTRFGAWALVLILASLEISDAYYPLQIRSSQQQCQLICKPQVNTPSEGGTTGSDGITPSTSTSSGQPSRATTQPDGSGTSVTSQDTSESGSTSVSENSGTTSGQPDQPSSSTNQPGSSGTPNTGKATNPADSTSASPSQPGGGGTPSSTGKTEQSDQPGTTPTSTSPSKQCSLMV